MSEDERYPVQAPGWAAIDRVMAAVHPGGGEPHQFTSSTGYDLDSPNPLPAISVYEGRPGPKNPPFWHYVTFGLTELFEKTSPNPDISGFGFEVTLKLPRDPEEDRPPQWPLRLLQGVGHYVLSGHGSLDSGHCIHFGGPLGPPEQTPPSPLHGVLCVPEPTVGKVETPHGSVLFLTLFGLTEDELQSVESWELERKVGLVNEVSPLAITDPARGPLTEDPRTAAIFRRYALKVLL